MTDRRDDSDTVVDLAAAQGVMNELLWQMATAWDEFVRVEREAAPRHASAAIALNLYGQSAPLMEARVRARAHPIDYAVSVLRDIADGYALLANHWTRAERVVLPLPERSRISCVLDENGVWDWAQELGIAIPIANRARRDTTEARAPRPPEFRETIAEALTAMLSAYEVMARIDEYDRPTAPGTREYRDAACREIWNARAWMSWRRLHGRNDLRPITALMIVLAQGFFCQCWTEAPTPLFPSVDYVRAVLGIDDNPLWLSEVGVELPDVFAR